MHVIFFETCSSISQFTISSIDRLADLVHCNFPSSKPESCDLSRYNFKVIEGWQGFLKEVEAGVVERKFLELSQKEMKDLIQSGDQIYLEAEELICREASLRRCAVSQQERLYRGQKLKNQNPIANFFPAFMATLKTAFVFFRPGKVPTIIWECSLLLGLYFQIFVAPYYLLVLLGGSIGMVNATALVVAALLASAVALYHYFERDESHPNELPPFELKNLVPDYRNGKQSGCVGRDEIIEQILRFLHDTPQTRQHILIVGENGAGKTRILEKVAEEVAKRSLDDWGIYDAKCLLDGTFDSYNSNREGRLKNIEKVLGKRQPKTVFLVDEWLGSALTDEVASFLKDTLTKTEICFIFTIGKDQFQALEKADDALRKEKEIKSDESPLPHGQMTALLERFDVIKLEDYASEELIRSMVRSEMNRMKDYVWCEPGIEGVAIELTGSSLKARQPVKLMKKAIAEVKKTFESPSHSSEDLKELQKKERELFEAYSTELSRSDHSDKSEAVWSEIKNVQVKMGAEKDRLAGVTAQIQKVALLGKQILSCEQRIDELVRCHDEQIKRLYYLVYIDLPARKKWIEELQAEIPPEYPTIVNRDLLEKLAKV